MSASNGNGSQPQHFDNDRLEACIARFQSQRDISSLSEIIELSQNRALTLIRHFKTTCYRPEDELLSDVNYKLMRSIRQFNPSKGSAFTFVSQVIVSTLKTSVSNQRRYWKRMCELDDTIVNTTVASIEDRSHADDLAQRIRTEFKTMLVNPIEIAAQRWCRLILCGRVRIPPASMCELLYGCFSAHAFAQS
jgi:hypothetical protein